MDFRMKCFKFDTRHSNYKDIYIYISTSFELQVSIYIYISTSFAIRSTSHVAIAAIPRPPLANVPFRWPMVWEIVVALEVSGFRCQMPFVVKFFIERSSPNVAFSVAIFDYLM